MRDTVLDSHAVVTFLFGERGCEKVVALLERAAEAERPALICAVNWAEVHYTVVRKAGADGWNQAQGRLSGLPLKIVDVGQDLAALAGELKTSAKMSLGDCFAAALAIERGADLYTGDPEFKAVEGRIKIVWL